MVHDPNVKSDICHVVHVVYRLSTGGLENVVVQLINKLPRDQFRHTVIALTDIDPQFAQRIERSDVDLIALHKPPGQTIRMFPKALGVFRRIKADVMHSCNLAAMELVPVAAMAGIPRRVHAEHGWELSDIDGNNWRYRLTRKLYAPLVTSFVAVSKPLGDYLKDVIKIPAAKLHHLPNGVDTKRFRPRLDSDGIADGYPFVGENTWTVGMVGRLVEIKNPLLLVMAMNKLAHSGQPGVDNIRLAIIGDGPLAEKIRGTMDAYGLGGRLWLPGTRSDIPEILRSIDCFALPSYSEATSCTLQEAMASGLDIITTRVGGSPDLLEHGRLGSLIPSNDADALGDEIYKLYVGRQSTDRRRLARETVVEKYGLDSVMAQYARLFKNA